MSYAGYHYGDVLLASGNQRPRDRGRNQIDHPQMARRVPEPMPSVSDGRLWPRSDAQGEIADAAASLICC